MASLHTRTTPGGLAVSTNLDPRPAAAVWRGTCSAPVHQATCLLAPVASSARNPSSNIKSTLCCEKLPDWSRKASESAKDLSLPGEILAATNPHSQVSQVFVVSVSTCPKHSGRSGTRVEDDSNNFLTLALLACSQIVCSYPHKPCWSVDSKAF